MSQVFDAYARYYELLYRDKDYAAEAEYVASYIRKQLPHAKRILELGCGVGTHAEHLARMGYVVRGVDLSDAMVAKAHERKIALSAEVATRLSFAHGDIRTLRTGEIYDVVIALFHVMSYQTTDSDLKAVFETAAVHLKPGGAFLFDFWYGPAVLGQKPEVRVKRMEDSDISITRIAEPVMHADQHVVSVNYTVFIEEKATEAITRVVETHRMRYLFMAELMNLAGESSFLHATFHEWMYEQPPSERSWSAFASLRASEK